MTWIEDDDGNKCSVECFGSAEAAQKALDSLKNCKDCTNCRSCVSCDSCDSCVSCVSCVSCDSCVSCVSCVSCDSCDSCRYCRSCDSCRYCRSCDSCRSQKGNAVATVPPVPIIKHIHQKVYAAASAPGALDMACFHRCQTTHCRAGWATTLAGEAGAALENYFGPSIAALKIYEASAPNLPISLIRFYDNDEDGMADMRRMAELEAALAKEPTQ